MKPKHSSLFLLAAATIVVTASSAFAATAIKSGVAGTTVLTDTTAAPNNAWTGGVGSNGSPATGDTVVWNNTSIVGDQTIANDVTWNSMIFGQSGSTLAGALNISGAEITLNSNTASAFLLNTGSAGANAVTISNNIKISYGTASAVVVGAGSGANRVQLGGDGGPLVLTGNVTATGTGTNDDVNLWLRGTNMGHRIDGNLTVDGQLGKGDTGTWTLNGTNTIGWVYANNGTLLAGSNQAFGTGTIYLSDNSAGSSPVIASKDSTARTYANSLDLTGGFASTQSAVFGQTSGGTGAQTFNGGVNLGTAARRITTHSDTTFAGDVTGTGGGITKLGAAKLTLSGNNTYTGTTVFAAGVLAAGNNTAFGTGTLQFTGGTIASSDATSRTFDNSVIDFANSSTFGTATTGDLKFTGNLGLGGLQKTITVNNAVTEFSGLVSSSTNETAVTKEGAGTLIFSGTNTYMRPIIVNAGTMKFARTASFYGGGVTSTSATKLTVNSGATGAFNVGGTGEFTEANITTVLGASNGTVGFKTGANLGLDTTNTVDGNFAFSTSLANPTGSTSLGLTKLGANTLELTGSNTYTGATLVSAGTLLVNGSLGATAVTVGSNGIIGGTGDIAGSLNFDAGATLNILNIGDALGITGSVTFDGFGFDDITGWDYANAADGTYTLLSGSNFDLTNVSNVGAENALALGDGRSAYFQNGSLQVVIIPEPSAALLGGIGLLALLRRRRN